MPPPQQQQLELEQPEMYATAPPMQLWRALMNWLAFLFQIAVQILRSTPSMAQVLSYAGLHHSYLPSPSFKPLPVVEIPLQDHGSSDDSDRSVNGDDDFQLDRLTVVLDLDETLICAYESTSLPDSIRNQAVESGVHCFELECVSSDKECEGKPKINYVTVFERPGLHEFLNGVAEFANMIIFTAGLEDYARPLLDKIDPKKLIAQRLYRPSTVSTKYREHVKDLTILTKDLRRIVLVDNNPFSFLLQPSNGIPCVPFSASQPRDNQLMEVLLPLLKYLSQQRDVRPVLYEKFRMPEWFQMHGIPASAPNV